MATKFRSPSKVDVCVWVCVCVYGQPELRFSDNPRMLSFQRLDVYQRAIELLGLVSEILADLPPGNAERADQLIRAAESVIRNIAEGAGRWSRQDGAKHYKIARGEAMECAASLDVMKLRQLVGKDRYERGIHLLEAVVSMLTRMVAT